MDEGFPQPNKVVESTEYPFKKAVDIVEFIRDTDEIRLRKEAVTKFDEWVPILFEAARATEGIEKAVYATALRTLGETVDYETYKNALSKLMTNPEAVEELIRQGDKEAKPWEFLKAVGKNIFRRKQKIK
jgi:hypothetical protein